MPKNLKSKLNTIRRFFRSGSGDEESPSAFLSRSARDPALKQMMAGYAWFMPLALWSNPFRGCWRLIRHRYRYRDMLQQPVIYFPHLESRPWWPSDDITAALEQGYDAIRQEFLAAQSRIARHPLQSIVTNGEWESVLLYRDHNRLDENCGRFPLTMDVVERLPICPKAAGQVYFSVIAPQTTITAHHGLTNSRIRYHLGIETPPGAVLTVAGDGRAWQKGHCIVFDDSFIHEVHNEGHSRRVVLIVDCWHPALTDAERAFVTELMRLLNIPGVFRGKR